jgi:hypothetical protein
MSRVDQLLIAGALLVALAGYLVIGQQIGRAHV